MSESKTSERRLTAHDRRLAALELRKQGKSFAAIAETLGCAVSNAYKMVMTALRETQVEPAAEVRQIEIARLDAMLDALWPVVSPNVLPLTDAEGNVIVSADPDRNVQVKAVMSAVKIMERRARLLGLDAPTKQEITGKDGGAIELVRVVIHERTDDDIRAEQEAKRAAELVA
jgi:hypothetical protein